MSLVLFLLLILNNVFFIHAMVNGNLTKPGEFKYQVAIKYIGDEYNCGGSIIGDRYVISAAHCFANKKLMFAKGPIKVVAGTNKLNETDDPRRVEVDIEKVYVPTNFGIRGDDYYDDIAVIKLKQSLELQKNDLQKLKLPPKSSETFAGKSAMVTGFGWGQVTIVVKRDGSVSKTGGRARQLRSGNTQILSNAECKKREYNTVKPSQLCAKMTRPGFWPYGTCDGDTGSPLVYDSQVLIGVLASNTALCNEAYFPSLYTRVSSYLTFIDDALNDRKSERIRSKVY